MSKTFLKYIDIQSYRKEHAKNIYTHITNQSFTNAHNSQIHKTKNWKYKEKNK